MPDSFLAGRYRLVAPLGAGGMGQVFLAEDRQLERRVAIKFLPTDTEADLVARERLRREALAAAALDHPFICKVYEIAEADGRVFIVLEYVEGETLAAAMRQGPLPLRRVVQIACQLAQALDAAHRRNILHRDLKPANVMITPQGHVKVMDFGLAKQLGTETLQPPATVTSLTGPGTRLGTPAYMSPEQVLGSPLDARSDIFSLGVILHELATGVHPFLRDTAPDTMAAVLRDPPSRGTRPAAEFNDLEPVIARMLSKACAERHQTMTEVLADFDALSEQGWSSTARPAKAASTAPAERTPFVGRISEAAELERALDRMLVGEGGFVLIGGEPGVGKTRLARELMAKAHARGCIGSTGQCYEMEGAPPFVPFVEIIEQLARLAPQATRVAMGEFAAEIAAIVPSLRKLYADIPPPPDVPAEQQRRLTFGAFLEYMQRGSRKSPGVYLLDDLHWADEPTLQLIHHITPHLASMRILVVGTYRDVELDVKRPFARMLESLLRQRLATRIPLRRLDESAVEQLLEAMSGSTPPSGVAKAVFRETEGNPFFVEEVYQHLCEEGRLFDPSGAWKTDLRVDTIEVPEGVRLVIGRRLERLGEHARKVLTAAAVIGRTFPVDLLSAIIDVTEDQVLDAIDEADHAQLVQADANQRTPRYSFVHELIRSTLVGDLSLPRRQRMHLRIADAIERLRAASLDSQASVLAHHLYQAGAAVDGQRTANALMLAGTRALEAGAFEEALSTFDNLLSLELGEHDPLVALASEKRGYALLGLGRADEACAAFDRALTIASAIHDDAGILRAGIGLGSTYGWRGRFPEAVAVFRRCLGALSGQARGARAQFLAWIATSILSPTHIEEAAEAADEALAITATIDDPHVLRRVLAPLGLLQRNRGEYASSAATLRHALALTPANAVWDRTDALSQLLVSEYYLGHFAACDALLPDLRSAADRAGHPGGTYLHDLAESWIRLARDGDLRAFLAVSLQWLHRPELRYLTSSAIGLSQLYLGEVERALETLAAVVRDMPDNYFTGMPQANLFAATALAGDHDRARALMPDVIALLPASGRTMILGAAYALDAFVTGLAHLGERDQRGALYPLTLDYITTGRVVAWVSVGPTTPELAAALSSDAAGLVDQSRAHFERSLHLSRELPIRNLEPTVEYWYGRTLRAAPDTADQARGRAMVEAALEKFQRYEMALHAGLAERFLRTNIP